jgi:hypothetical protein
LPVLSIIVAFGALSIAYLSALDANRAREIENQHFQELTKPQALKQAVLDNLDVLDRLMSRAEAWVSALRDKGQDVSELSSDLGDASGLRTEAEAYFLNDRLSDAERDIEDAVDLLTGILQLPLHTDFSPVTLRASGMLILSLDMDPETIGKTSDGGPLQTITIAADGVPSPGDQYIVVSAYDFTPDGATFDRPITVRLNYDPSNIPEGVEEKELVLVSWNNDSNRWTEIPHSSIDTNSNIVTGKISTLSPMAVLARLPAQVSVTNWWPYLMALVIVATLVIAVILCALFVPPKKKPSIGFRPSS